MTSGLAPHRVSALGVARKLQIPSVFADLSIADNLSLALWSGRAGKLPLLDPRLRRWTSPMLKGTFRSLVTQHPVLMSTAGGSTAHRKQPRAMQSRAEQRRAKQSCAKQSWACPVHLFFAQVVRASASTSI
jgi:ABC-type branched-subunit amino acid transport system ATPase component